MRKMPERMPLKRRRLRDSLALLVACLGGCAHGTIAAKGSDLTPPIDFVGSVRVFADASVQTGQPSAFGKLGGDGVVAEEIKKELEDRHLYDQAGTVKVEVRLSTAFLRSTARAFWAGVWAGSDRLAGEVYIRRGLGDQTTYSIELSGLENLYGNYGAHSRLTSLGHELGKEIASVLERVSHPETVASRSRGG